jgi:LuxR family transcriptional regulator, maltose regulon positive regulatory protein
LVQAEIFEHLGDHQAAKDILEEADSLVHGCADAGIASTMFPSAPQDTGVAATSRNEWCAASEELTPKELEVLRLLPTRLSRREIAARLYVSINTVKTHQRVVYRKLCVEHRGAAVTKARELGLL